MDIYFAFPLSSHKFAYGKMNISEQGGVRPVLVVQNDTGNKFSTTTIVASITSIVKKHKLPTHIKVTCDFLEKESIVLLEQIRTVDKNRLSDYLGQLNEKSMQKIDEAIEISFGLNCLERLENIYESKRQSCQRCRLSL